MQSSSFARSPSQQANESVVNEDEEELLQDRAEPKMENDTGAGADADALRALERHHVPMKPPPRRGFILTAATREG